MSKKLTERDWEVPEFMDWDESERQTTVACNPNCVPMCVPSCVPSCAPSVQTSNVGYGCPPMYGGGYGSCRPYSGGGYGGYGGHGGHRQVCVPSCVPSCAPSCVPYAPVCYPSHGCRPVYGGCRPHYGGGYGGHRPPE